jgi:hypothetical protein
MPGMMTVSKLYDDSHGLTSKAGILLQKIQRLCLEI